MSELVRALSRGHPYLGPLIIVLFPITFAGILIVHIIGDFGLRLHWRALGLVSAMWFFFLALLSQRSATIKLSDALKFEMLKISVVGGAAAVLCSVIADRPSDDLSNGRSLVFAIAATAALAVSSFSGLLIGHASRLWSGIDKKN
jgi:hypothetical protein